MRTGILKTKLGTRSATFLWLVTLSAIFVELVGTLVDRTRVPTDDDWRAAAAFVRARSAPHDLFVSAPSYTDPLLRWAAGDLLTPEQAGRSDLESFGRIWALSVDGHHPADAPRRPPDLEKRFGRVQVSRWTLDDTAIGRGETPPLSLLPRIADARVSLGGRPCERIDAIVHGGGLGTGPLPPRRRFVCDPRRPWLWVGETITEDLELEPRHCVAQHPAGAEPLRVELPRVRLRERLVFYGGLYYEHERERVGEAIRVAILLDDEEVAGFLHRDGDGWAKVELDTSARAGTSASLIVETSTKNPLRRSYCWAASLRGDAP